MMLRGTATFLVLCGTLAANPEPSPSAPAHEHPPAEELTKTSQEASTPADSHNALEAAGETAPSATTQENPAPEHPAASHHAAPNTDAHARAAASDAAEGTTLAAPVDDLHVQQAHAANSEELESLLRIGRAKRDRGDFASAEIAFLQVLAEHATPAQDREAILGLARTYRKKGDFTKAAATYESFIKAYSSDPELPTVYLELGRTLRALGAYKQAISRFYSVLNSTLKFSDQGADQYRQLVRTAQYEIAESYFQTGDYAQANRFFSRLKLLDLAPEDRARAYFKSVFALTLAGDHEKAAVGLRSFIDQFPEDENVPEAQYLLSVSLRRLNRTQESLQATLKLLKVESARTQKDARRWRHWQRKTGNQLANELYENGEIDKALQIYLSLAQLSPDPAWNLPVVYQMGLCYERLRSSDRARECYKTIIDSMAEGKTQRAAHPELADLAEMAVWRLSQIDWQAKTDAQLSAMFTPGATAAPAAPALLSPPASTPPVSAVDHDAHGSSTIASHAVR